MERQVISLIGFLNAEADISLTHLMDVLGDFNVGISGQQQVKDAIVAAICNALVGAGHTVIEDVP